MAYELDGVQYPSVTTITGMLDKPALINWAAGCAVDYIAENIDAVKDPTDVHKCEQVLLEARKAHTIKRDSAAGSGTKCHSAIELFIQGNNDQEIKDLLKGDEDAQSGYSAFLQWVEDNKVEWLEIECAVFSQFHGYAGRFDAIAVINGVRTLIDFKTSSGVYDEMKWQLCAYRQAYNECLEEGGEPIDRIGILHLNKKTGEPAYYPITKDIDRMTELFNKLTWCYYLMKNRRLKSNPFVQRAKLIGQPVELNFENKKAPF